MKKVGFSKSVMPPSSKLPLLLYVEDNDDNWHVTELRLGRSYRLVRAKTDREACAILQRPDELYAILMDIELGGSQLNGIQLTKLIRGKLPRESLPEYAKHVPLSQVPVFFVTAYGNAYPHDDLMACGVDDVLLKPINFTRMTVALTNLYVNRVLVR